MKKTPLLLCSILILLLAACGIGSGSSETSGAAGNPSGIDRPALKLAPEDRNQTLWGILDFVETEDGYYYAHDYYAPEKKMIGLYVYFCPRGGDQFFPLCGKPNCMHNDQNCNAFYLNGSSLGYYNGALYVIESNYTSDERNLVRCNLDGTDRRVVTSLPCDGGFSSTYHRGKYYIYLYANENGPLEKQEDRAIVLDLADGSQSDFAPDLWQAASVSFFSFYQNKAYGFEIDRSDLLNGKTDAYQLFEYDLVTGEGRKLGFDTETTIWCVEDSTLHWFESDKDYMGKKYCDAEPGFWEYDLVNGTLKNLGLPFEDANTAVWDADYIYLMGFANRSGNNRTLYFLSKDYQVVDQIKLEGDNVLAVAASDRVFVCDMDAAITGYIDKSDIGSGNLVVKPIQTVG